MTEPAPETGDTQPPAETGGEQQQQEPQQPEPQPKPTETVDFWKQKARQQEDRAKANAKAAEELQKIKDGEKTEVQKAIDAAAQAKAEADEAKAAMARFRVAASNGVPEDHFDLLGTGTEEEIAARAKKVGQWIKDSAELAQLKAGQQQQQGPQPVKGLTPGAPTPPDDSYPPGWFPQLRQKQDQQSSA